MLPEDMAAVPSLSGYATARPKKGHGKFFPDYWPVLVPAVARLGGSVSDISGPSLKRFVPLLKEQVAQVLFRPSRNGQDS